MWGYVFPHVLLDFANSEELFVYCTKELETYLEHSRTNAMGLLDSQVVEIVLLSVDVRFSLLNKYR